MRRCAQTVALTSSSLDDSTDPDHEGAWCTWQGYGHRGHASHIEKVGFLAHDYRVISCGGHDSATYQWRIRGPSKPCATLTTRRSTSVALSAARLSITAPFDSCLSVRLWAGRRRRKGWGWACYSRRLSSLELGSVALLATGSGPRACPLPRLATTSACKKLCARATIR